MFSLVLTSDSNLDIKDSYQTRSCWKNDLSLLFCFVLNSGQFQMFIQIMEFLDLFRTSSSKGQTYLLTASSPSFSMVVIKA